MRQDLWELIHFTAATLPAASSITLATSLGCDSMATWLEGNSVVAAFISLAMLRSCCGAIILSLLETIYQVGLFRHAAAVGFASKIEP